MEPKKTLVQRMVLTFGAPSAYLEPSWLQVSIFIDFKCVLASLGSLLGLSWEGFGPILAPSRPYLDPPCACCLLSSGCLGFPTLPAQDLPGMPATNVCHKLPGSKRGAAVAPPTGLSIKLTNPIGPDRKLQIAT